MQLVMDHAGKIGVRGACQAFGVPEASYYRWRENDVASANAGPKARHWRRLSESEESVALELLTSDRFMDMAPEAIESTLLDEGRYVASGRTLYRILERNTGIKERRNQLRHPAYTKPELLATGPNQVWSWDITKLKLGPKWSYLHLYVVLDIFSRYVVGWMVASKEDAMLAERLIAECCIREGVLPLQLTIHADRGAAMKSKAVAQLMADLQVTRSHSRPHVSNDNPFSEAQFKTLKYHKDFPKHFESQETAREFLAYWFEWYNHQHRHSGIKMLCPADVHHGRAQDILTRRHTVRMEAYARHPERFPLGTPKLEILPPEVWINKPNQQAVA